ncbi:[citrate (pro-3S)-lyase] ligase [uncultured Oscillibacter sp.]|uniref:[citrate (pro-3S)-lyase] ligase n=1 Tax=uncultured Oscillibacter sp. TaxID=876091 RepID=UPI002623BA52|nr:[citrate (pro-3S)-lyase] ligase [uncultured Oscillibacter sp.]
MEYAIRTVRPEDRELNAMVDGLLRREGIRRDANLDYTCALLDEEGRIAATGSCFQNTLRCFAVDRDHQGEGLMNQLAAHLIRVQADRGNLHLFVYTKCETARFFRDLGFHPVAEAPGDVSFLENRRTGFSRYLRTLEVESGPQKGGVAGAVVMNANPFTLGHRYLAELAAAQCGVLHLFVVSEDASVVPFAVRRRLVREGTAHLDNVVLHETGPYLISSAIFPSYFLRDEDAVIRAHAALDLEVFGKIASSLGIARRYVGEERSSHVTALYNETLGRRLPELGVECRVVPRLEADGKPVSAGAVRQAIHDGRLEDIRPLVPETTWRYFHSPEAGPVLDAIRREETVIHY